MKLPAALFQFAVVALLFQVATAKFRADCEVTNTNDSGQGSLRECLEQADAAVGAGSFKIKFANDISGETIVNPGTDYAEVTGPGKLIIRGPKRGTINIDATVPIADGTRLPVVFFTGPSVDLDISDVTVKGGFECIRMAFDIEFGGGESDDVSLDLHDFHCSEASGSGLLIDENIGSIHISDSSFNNCGSSGMSIEPQEPEEGAYEISLTNVEANDNELWGVSINVESSAAGGTLSVTKFTGDRNRQKYGLEAIDSGVGRMNVIKVVGSHFNDNREGCEFINADVRLIKNCEFNGNGKYGLGVEQSHVSVIKTTEIQNNGEYAFDTEALASIEELYLNKISGNGLGTFQCQAPGGKRKREASTD